MKRFLVIVLSLLFSTNHTFCQNFRHEDYSWGEAKWVEGPKEETKTILKRHEIIEFDFSGDNYAEYYLKHTVEYINSDDEIERNNKKYIPYYSSSDILKAKARVIKRKNEIIELDKSRILESKDEESGRMIKYFALEGLEKGDIVEVLYVVKRFPNFFGSYFFFQGEYTISDFTFELICPDYLGFAFDIKNDTTGIQHDSTLQNKTRYTLNVSPVFKLKNEDNSPYNSLRKRVVYKLDKNLNSGTSNLVSYESTSQSIYKRIYTQLEKADNKALAKFNKGLKIAQNETEAEKIRTIEDYVKNNISVIEEGGANYNTVSFAIANRTASKFGIAKILANMYNIHGVDHQIVLTTDRTIVPFDKEFVSYHNLSRYVIYFPVNKTFVSPDAFEYRNGIIPAQYTDNYGLFIKEVSLGEFKSGIGQIKYIPLLDYNKTNHSLDVTAVIKDNFTDVDLNIIQSSSGYYAVFIQSYLDLVGEDIYNQIGKDFIKGIMDNLEVKEWEFKNVGANKVDKEPLILQCEATSSSLVDVAGNNYLFKVGELIGPQIELYSKAERRLPVHDDYKREFVRKIVITIPDGYKVQNPGDLKIYEEFGKEGKKILLFDSQYTIDGQKITININEYYDQVYYDLEEYQYYRNVVNSASDFNKVTLVITKI